MSQHVRCYTVQICPSGSGTGSRLCTGYSFAAVLDNMGVRSGGSRLGQNWQQFCADRHDRPSLPARYVAQVDPATFEIDSIPSDTDPCGG